jgi:UDP-N-acetylmuramyl pentapeptide phosphotransferase/UDP-N-acetylglucosamine-1-phosphate transferase
MAEIFIDDQALALAVTLAVSLLLSVFLVLTKSWHGAFTLDGLDGVQKMHLHSTPRIGGLPIYISLWLASFFVAKDTRQVLELLLIAGMPAFAFGFAEDLTKRVGVLTRLLATMASGVLAWWLTGYSLTRLDFWFLDMFLVWLPVSVLFTAFAIGGVANAINIIDGLNGLSSITAILGFIGLGLIAHAVGDPSLASVAALCAVAVFGFFCLNWPFGKMFLGDGGAYFIGFALAWISVLLTERHGNVTAFVALLICIHPITEVVFSIYRRRVRHMHPGQPDRLHLHSLIKTRLVRHRFASSSVVVRNSIAGLLVGCLTILPVGVAQFSFNSTRLSIIAVLLFVWMYLVIYARLVRFRWVSPINFIGGIKAS